MTVDFPLPPEDTSPFGMVKGFLPMIPTDELIEFRNLITAELVERGED